MALAVFCIYAVDFAINGGKFSASSGRNPDNVLLMEHGHSASDLSQPDRGHSSRISAAAWLSLGSVKPLYPPQSFAKVVDSG